MGLYTNVNSLIFEYTTVVKISENETALNSSFGVAIANPIKAAFLTNMIAPKN